MCVLFFMIKCLALIYNFIASEVKQCSRFHLMISIGDEMSLNVSPRNPGAKYQPVNIGFAYTQVIEN